MLSHNQYVLELNKYLRIVSDGKKDCVRSSNNVFHSFLPISTIKSFETRGLSTLIFNGMAVVYGPLSHWLFLLGSRNVWVLMVTIWGVQVGGVEKSFRK